MDTSILLILLSEDNEMKKYTFNVLVLFLIIILLASCESSNVKNESSIENSSTHIEQSYNDPNSNETPSDSSSDEVSSKAKLDLIFKVPEEFKHLASGKAINSIDTFNGCIFEIICETPEKEYSVKCVGKGNAIRIITNQKDKFHQINEDVLILDNEIFFLDGDTKTYTISKSFDLDKFGLFNNMVYSNTIYAEKDGVEYIIDKFVSAKDKDHFIEYHVSEGRIKYCKSYYGETQTYDLKYEFSFLFEDIDRYLVFPEDYVMKSLKETVSEHFAVPQEFTKYELGKTLSLCDVKKGFSIMINILQDNNLNESDGYYAVYKEDMAYVAYYDIVNGISSNYTKAELYKFGKRYDILGEGIQSDVLGEGLNLKKNFFDGLLYQKSTEKEEENVVYTIETYSVDGIGLVDFYFEEGELCAIKTPNTFIIIQISTTIDESVFELVSDN